MQSYAPEVRNLTYNAAEQQFEALVVLHEGADQLSFPTSLNAPITTDFQTVARSLVVQAKLRRARGARDMVSRLSRVSPVLPHAA